MKTFLELLTDEMKEAFTKAGYDTDAARVTVSNRPDLCEYQCNGAMACAKAYKKAPIMIAGEVAKNLENSKVFSSVEAVMPGFLNLCVGDDFLLDYVKKMSTEEKFGVEVPEKIKKIIIDYGGANVAKPLHVGHLRSAVIGESVKRICRYVGHTVIGDVHLGDWGQPMGLVISLMKEENPDWVYFDENYTGDYPEVPPFNVQDFSRIYPEASARSKVDADFKAKAMEATYKLQTGVRGYRAIWNQILALSKEDLKKNYDNLHIEFDLWKGESDVHDIIPDMVDYMKKNNYAYISEGALVVDVKEDSDTKEMPPCMILKSDGAALYNTTDLATIMERQKLYALDEIVYLTDKRQSLYFEQVFRCAHKTKLVPENVELKWIGFGTMNGPDGTPFKTRDGGVLQLAVLIKDTEADMLKKIREGREMSEEEAVKVSKQVALAAIKYGDLSNQASKDYIFDSDRFTSFEGDTGPYILYTIVRIKSILSKFAEQGGDLSKAAFAYIGTEAEKGLMKELAKFNAMMMNASEELAPHKVCAYIYDLCNAFNHFYHETKILGEENEERKAGLIALLVLTKDILLDCIDVLGFDAPERM